MGSDYQYACEGKPNTSTTCKSVTCRVEIQPPELQSGAAVKTGV